MGKSNAPDIVCLTETWLKGDKGPVVFDDCEWFEHIRLTVSRKVV